MNFVRKVLGILWDLVETTTFALGFVMVTYLFLFQTGEVHGASSYPTWQENDKFIVEKISYNFTSPERGDFVVLKSPQNQDIDFIKRIVGLPNETLTISEGHVYINGIMLNEDYLQKNVITKPDQKLFIPSGYYFVMGDNRENSSDSRVFGPIPKSSIVGKVVLRFWPADKLREIF